MIGAPIIALIIFTQCLDYLKINPIQWFESNIYTKEKYEPYVNHQVENEKTAETTNNALENNIDILKTLKNSEYRPIIDKSETKSEFKGNQLENGESPLDSCFGKGIYSQQAWLLFDNSNKSDAIVCLVRHKDHKTIRNEYIRAGNKFEMSKIPSGVYYIKVYYGNDWNPNKKNFCGINGAFDNNERFSKSDKIGDHITIQNTDRTYTTGTITLYDVENGNMSTENIDEEEFFES